MVNVGVVNKSSSKFNGSPSKNISFHNLEHHSEFYKGFYYFPKKTGFDVIHSNLPCISADNHIQRLNSVVFNFGILDVSFDRKTRLEIWKDMVLKESCRRIVFNSRAGYNYMAGDYYAKIKDKRILNKAEVVYPGFEPVPDFKKKKDDYLNILMATSDFYKDSGEQIVDAFLRLRKSFDAKLTVFAKNLEGDSSRNMSYGSLRHKSVLNILKSCKDISFHPLDNKELYHKCLHEADIFVKVPLKEWNFSLVEPMGYGLPVITSDSFALPEIAGNNKEGLLVRIDDYNFMLEEKNGQSIVSKRLDSYLKKEIYSRLKLLVENDSFRKKLGLNAKKKARTRFSLQRMDRMMAKIYEKSA